MYFHNRDIQNPNRVTDGNAGVRISCRIDNQSVYFIQRLLNLGDLRNISVPVPNIELQQKYAVIAKKYEHIYQSYMLAIEKLDTLFGSLQQRAFRGEL